MTKTLFATIAGAFALLATSTSLNAQTSSRMDFAHSVTTMASHTAEEGVVTAGELSSAAVSNKVTRSFSKTFQGITPKWYANNDQYLARFKANGAVTHALYEKNGYMVYSVTKGPASLLPSEVTKLLQEVYPCYNITTGTKAVSLGTTAWIADLTLGNSLLVVKVIDGEIEETTRYRTQSN